MSNGYQCPAGTRLKANVDFGPFGGGKVDRAPFEYQSFGRLPELDVTRFEHLASARALEGLEQAPAQPGLQVHDTPLLAQPVAETAPPPSVDLFGEHGNASVGGTSTNTETTH